MSINASNNPYPDSPDASPTKLDKGGYDGTAETLDNKIDEILAEAKILINNTLVGSASLGSIVPSSVPPATGAVHAFATQAGTYTNFGGVVVAVNSFAVISRNAGGAFSISQTTLDITSTVNPLLSLKANLKTGKNKFNKDDTSILQGGYLNASGVFLVFGTTYATHFIPILAGQTLYSNQAVTTAGQYHTFYDANKTFISSVQSVKTITATVDGFVKFTCGGATNINQVEVGTVATTYEVYKLSINKDDIISVNDSAIPTTITRSSDIINTLVSTSTTAPLSAAQGKVLKDLVDTKVNTTVTDNLTSTSATNALSANQGRVLDLKIAQGIVNWTAKAFLINDEVSHLGKLWQANAAIISTDVPGTSSKWVEILTGYPNFTDLNLKATLIPGKNKFNKDDTSVILNGYLLINGVFQTFGTGYVTHFIPILAGQSLYCNFATTSAGAYHILYDANKAVLANTTGVKSVTATVNGFVKFSCQPIGTQPLNLNQVEAGTVGTTYEAYKLSINKDDIISINDSAISTAIARSSDVTSLVSGKVDLSPAKNKFNKNDSGILTGKYIDNLGVVQTFGAGFITHYIPIKSGQTFFCNNANLGVGIGHSFYNSSKVLVSTVTGVKLITASQDGFVRYSVGAAFTVNTTQVEEGTAFTTYEAYYLGVDSDLIQNDIQRASKHTEITVKRIGTSGVDANFCGLNAIGDALASITDASSINTYNIVVEGVFLFKLQSDFVYSDPSFAEPTVIIGKDWVNIEGKGKENTVIAVELTAGQTFTGGKIYTDFQPVMWNCNSKLSNMSIIGKNCRYSIHMEAENFANNKTATFENLYVNFKGSQEMGGGAGNAIGTGMRLGQTWNFNNCEIVTIGGSPFGVHTALALLQKGGEINFTDCSFWGNIFFHNYPSGRVVNLNLNNCKFNRTRLNPNFYYTTYSTLADYMDFNLKLTTPPIPYFNTHTKGKGLKIESKSQGVSSSVKFNENSTAFNSIIGNSNVLVESRNYALNKTQFGYQWKNGGVGLNGYAIGGLDIDSANTAKTNGLGVLLGNCATVNKTLTVIVDGTTYNIVFNENFTAQNNAYVIAKITAIIGTVANVTEFCPSSEYYPDFGSMESLLNEDTTAILKGMGIVYTTNGMRRALNSDNRIDGICLYDTVIGEYGKCIKQGVIYTSNSAQRFSIAEDVNASRSVGSELGISATAGVFSLTSTPKLLRTIETNIVQII